MAPSGSCAGQLEADDPRDQHRHGLAEHRGLGLDATDAPADDAEAVDHRRVRVGAHTGVRVGDSVAHVDDLGQVLDVDLMHDPGARRHHLEVVEGALAPAQELVALLVAAVLDVDVALERRRRAEHVRDHRVVDDQLGGRERVDRGRVATEVAHGLTHGGQVDDRRDTGEVLHDHPRGRVLDLLAGLTVSVPSGDRPDIVCSDVRAVLGAQQVLQQHLEAVRQAGDIEAVAFDAREAVDLVRLVANLQ